jgi:hypothetical protein
MAQVGNGLLRNQAALLILVLLIVLVIGGVIFPAVWSRKRTRGTAPLADYAARLLLGFRWHMGGLLRWLTCTSHHGHHASVYSEQQQRHDVCQAPRASSSV